MKINSVKPRGIVIEAEFTLEEVNMILDYLDHATVAYEVDTDEKMKKADEYVRKVFVDLSKLAEDFSGEN